MGNENSTETESRRSKIRHKLQNLRSRRRLRRPGSGSVSGLSSQRSVSQEDFADFAVRISGFGIPRRSSSWRKMDQLCLGSRYLRYQSALEEQLLKNNIIGYCELDLLDFVVQEPDSTCKLFDLLDPASSNVVGSMFLSCSVEDPVQTETCFAKRILSIVDYNKDGHLSFSEFSDLMNAFDDG